MTTAIDHIKPELSDKQFQVDIQRESFVQHQLTRVHAVDKTFTEVDFKQAFIQSCYFRNCRFIRCDFTGAQIKDTNLKGSTFSDCKFLYTTWEKTMLEEEFLESCLPAEENLARDLVRSLRVNFTQTGNYEAVNRAAAIEVQLTGRHLYNAAYSRQSYHRRKYKGWDRARIAAKHAQWKLLDLVWGNGESIVKVARSCLVVILLAAIAAAWIGPRPGFLSSLELAFMQFWGVGEESMSPPFAITLTIARYILFGLFMAILVKRLSRR